MNKPKVDLYTDGACSGNPGPGGFAAILVFGKREKEVTGYESRTTNNRMEVRAAIEGLTPLNQPCDVTIHTDSKHLINALACLDDMPLSNWTTKTGAKRANCDLLKQLYSLKHTAGHTLFYEYTPGHSGNVYNERCDSLAKKEIVKHAV